MLSKLTGIDLFGQPFYFRTDTSLSEKHLAKKTMLGSVVSIVCYIIALLYLIYLLEEYINQKIPPQISEITVNHLNAISEKFDKEPLTVNINLPDTFSNVDISQYFSVYLVAIGVLQNDSIKLTPTTAKIVGDQYQHSYHINKSKDIQLQSDYIKKSNNQYFQIVLQKCQPGGPVTCKSDTEIEQLLKDDDCELDIEIYYEELNVKTGKLGKKHDNIHSIIDPLICQVLDLKLLMGTIDVDNGFILTKFKTHKYIKGFEKHTQYFTAQYVEDRWGKDNSVYIDALKVVTVRLAAQSKEYVVIYEKFSQLIAKYFALFNTIIIIGIIAKIGSEAKLYEMMYDTYLVSYYKKSAAKIHHQNSLLEKLEQKNDNKKVDVEENNNKISFKQILPGQYEPLNKFQTAKSALYHTMGPTYYNKQQENKEKYPIEEENGIINLKNMYFQQFQRITAQHDFRTLYGNILSTKAAMQLLFTPEQYAAIQFVGREIKTFNDHDDVTNHLEKIDLIEQSPEYRDQLVLKYLQDKNKNNSELDQKIKECLIPQVQQIIDSPKNKNQDKEDYDVKIKSQPNDFYDDQLDEILKNQSNPIQKQETKEEQVQLQNGNS